MSLLDQIINATKAKREKREAYRDALVALAKKALRGFLREFPDVAE